MRASPWRGTASGGLSAHSSFAIPPAAKLGVYQVELRGGRGERSHGSGEFRVEEFRLPVLEGRIGPTDSAGSQPLVRVRSVPASVQVNYVAGGGAAHLPVRVSALVRSKYLQFADHDSFSFSPPRQRGQGGAGAGDGDEEEAAAGQDGGRSVAARSRRLRHQPCATIASTSIRAPRGSPDTWMVERAGYGDWKYSAITAFTAAKSERSIR